MRAVRGVGDGAGDFKAVCFRDRLGGPIAAERTRLKSGVT